MADKPRPELSERAKKIIAAASIAVFVLLTLAITWFVGRPLIEYLREPEKFRAWVDGAGVMGRVYFLGIQILQVVVAIIPGEPVEIGAGYAFGAVEGTLLCMLGTVIFMTLFWQLPATTPVWVYFVVLCAAGFCIYGPQALIGIAAANQATKRAAATANGFKGMFGYASTLVSGAGLGFLADHYGWNSAYIGIIVVAFICMGILMLMWNAPADGYDHTQEKQEA